MLNCNHKKITLLLRDAIRSNFRLFAPFRINEDIKWGRTKMVWEKFKWKSRVQLAELCVIRLILRRIFRGNKVNAQGWSLEMSGNREI